MQRNICFPFLRKIIGLLLFYPAIVMAQISEGGTPPSFEKSSLLKSTLSPLSIPINFSVEDLKTVDAWQVSHGSPLSVSTILPVDISLTKDGRWTTLSDGQKICQLRIQAPDAIALMLYYKRFYIPKGGKLFIYNTEKSQILGAYTSQTNQKNSKFATEFVAGDELTLEYVPGGEEEASIEIEGIGYGYNHLSVSSVNTSSLKSTSGSCQVNINCEEGDAWQAEKKGVCYTVQKVRGKGYICSASLLNNTAEDLKPYILSANHCAMSGDSIASADDFNQWAFYFHRERESCDNNSLPVLSRTMVGCKRIAYTPLNGGSDGLLLLLNSNIPEYYDVYYNGWDRTDTPAASGVSIHHPSGDYKKISTFTKSAQNSTFNSTDGSVGAKNAHWNVIFVQTTNGHAVTEGGSSGSPLFNQNKLVVGSLTGGNSECDTPNGSNLYGKLSYHWNKYTADSMRMDIYLDPIGKGVAETLSGKYATISSPPPTALTSSYSNNKVTLNWTVPATSLSISHYNIYYNNTLLGETTTTSYIHETPSSGSQTYSVSAVYSDESESTFAITSIYISEYKQPTDLTVQRTNTTDITLTWKAPVYTQNIYWGNGENGKYSISYGSSGFYFGQRWEKSDILSLHKKTITAVNFVPFDNSSYTIYITQDGTGYKQPVNNATTQALNKINLTTPFVIDSSKGLIISIYAYGYGNKHPALLDDGPAIEGKGDILSIDGNEWNSLSAIGSDYNFFLSATISSTEGELATSTSSIPSITRSRSSEEPSLKTNPSSLNITKEETVSLRSVQPAAFPEVTAYKIYRDNYLIATVPPQPTQYIDKNIVGSDHIYYITAVYGTEESQKSNPVANESILAEKPLMIYPTVFTSEVQLANAERVKQIDVFSAKGDLVLHIISLSNRIDTSSLPQGYYFFRIKTKNGKEITIRGLKK